jgi:predicted nucleic acid-binding protein
VTLTDTGPLYALIDVSQTENHQRCVTALAALTKPLITTWPCFTEAMYLLFTAGGWTLQKLLWRYVESETLHFYDLTESDIARMQTLMEKYHDTPMDLADASLVAAAEALDLKRIFTLDSDFYVYRRNGRDV